MEMEILAKEVEALMLRVRKARRTLEDGKYSNGSYSGNSVCRALIDLNTVEDNLYEMMKSFIRIQGEEEAKEKLLAEIIIQIKG